MVLQMFLDLLKPIIQESFIFCIYLSIYLSTYLSGEREIINSRRILNMCLVLHTDLQNFDEQENTLTKQLLSIVDNHTTTSHYPLLPLPHLFPSSPIPFVIVQMSN